MVANWFIYLSESRYKGDIKEISYEIKCLKCVIPNRFNTTFRPVHMFGVFPPLPATKNKNRVPSAAFLEA